mmetsp:Transcript_92621/g.257992  ORF Transcript_92621/g.257992 Transcript_92621/m.257992 type:complete len:247 (-) Transcript_92621:23-763(-)
MPVELWLECMCDVTNFGEELVVVGDHPSFGSWRVEDGVPLVTSAAAFPRWTFRRPVRLEEDPRLLPPWIEYKYVVHRDMQSFRWEDVGTREVPTFHTSARAGMSPFVQLRLVQRPANRCLPGPRGTRLHQAHVVAMRIDRFGERAAAAEACWAISPDWAPDLAGGDVTIGPDVYLLGEWPCPYPADLAAGIFVLPRFSRLRRCLRQVGRKLLLPGELWFRVLAFLGGGLLQEPVIVGRWSAQTEFQ